MGFDGLGECRVAAIACGDEAISDHPLDADPLDRGAGEERAECSVVQGQQVGQRRRDQFWPRQERPVGLGSVGEPVPRTDCETIVAPVDAVADRFPVAMVDRSLMLDGEVGNAAPGIELAGGGDCAGRTGVDAALAIAAVAR